MTDHDSTELRAARARAVRLPRTHFIDNRFTPTTGPSAQLVNPADGTSLGACALGGAEDVHRAVDAATRAQHQWARTTAAERAGHLLRLADAIDAHADTLVQLESLNGGKPIAVAAEEILGASDALRFFAGACRTAQTPAPGEYVRGHLSIVRREPLGVVGAIAPWNYPLMMAVWKIAPALAAGNTVVLKPSELTPLTTLMLAELAADILPAGVLNVVLGTGTEVGEAIATHPGIALVSLTGSVASGQAVARSASSNLKRVHLELGGKAPVLVFEDADLDEVARTLRSAGLWNSGQECGAATRVLCHQAVHDDLVALLVGQWQQVTLGDPAAEAAELGPLISVQHLARVEGMVRQAREDGATIATGGRRVDRAGYFFEPTIITHARPDADILGQEIFGPVVTVETFSDDHEALALANLGSYGLSASVWTHDLGRSLRMTSALDFGTVWVNSHLTLASEMPWNGFGMSGYGRDMSTLGLDDYTRFKHVVLAESRHEDHQGEQ
ncbi:aminobutyraldehyde dehydrogenase [Aeromicrobium endophyticum]|uniref:Aldehyde dehydrogenase family protein n=1 Tax=Aeromicrobium endophyticum TaxID=2292704 RepID=A0A371NYT1_9ACTN|nr:aminobutyraldehyde dehydrogenase [Aeromicrobium endophyticum]REK68852.1 aldehyde dehydrogenase family protein [Aeromicrobium endophyticum]